MLQNHSRAIFAGSFILAAAAASASWPQLYDGPTESGASGNVVRVDDSGNVYMAGEVYSNTRQNPYLVVVKYSGAGTVLWSTIYGSNDAYQNPVDMVIDPQKNVYVTSQNKDNGRYQWGTTKFGPQGTFRWIRYETSPYNGTSLPRSIQVAPDGDIVVTGSEEISANKFEIAVVRYHPSGATKWVQTYTNPSGNIFAQSSAISTDGSVAIAGYQLTGNGLDLLTLKYDLDGNQQWSYSYDGPSHGDDAALDVAFDSGGNVLVGGQTTFVKSGTTDTPTSDFLTVKLSPTGQELWINRYGDSQRNEFIRYIRVDHQNNIVVAGNPYEGFDGNVTIEKIDPDGQRLWVKKFDGMVGAYAALSGLAIGKDDSIYVGGNAIDPSNSLESFMMLKYRADGHRLYAHYATANDGGYAQSSSMAYDPKSNRAFETGIGGSDGVGLLAMTTRF